MWGRYALLLLDKKKLFPEKSQGLGFLSQAVGLLSQALGLFWEKLKNQYLMRFLYKLMVAVRRNW